MVEALIGLPVLCLLGLTVLQVALVMHARDALRYAVFEAARAGSVAHARRDAIESGLARGLAPLYAPGPGARDSGAPLMRATTALQAGLSAGWIRLRTLSPTRESFSDWGTPAASGGDRTSEVIEIPVDNLPTESLRRKPASGSTGDRAGAPIGSASGQTLADASLLRLELIYGVPASVPLAGRVIVWALRIIDGCEVSTGKQVGLVDLGRPVRIASGRNWACSFYEAVDARGPRPRLPVRVTALIRMQTAPRLDAATPARVATAAPGAVFR